MIGIAPPARFLRRIRRHGIQEMLQPRRRRRGFFRLDRGRWCRCECIRNGRAVDEGFFGLGIIFFICAGWIATFDRRMLSGFDGLERAQRGIRFRMPLRHRNLVRRSVEITVTSNRNGFARVPGPPLELKAREREASCPWRRGSLQVSQTILEQAERGRLREGQERYWTDLGSSQGGGVVGTMGVPEFHE